MNIVSMPVPDIVADRFFERPRVVDGSEIVIPYGWSILVNLTTPIFW
jgi:hypothetical protein